MHFVAGTTRLSSIALVLSALAWGCGIAPSADDDRAPVHTASTTEALLGASDFGFAFVQSNAINATRSYNSRGGANAVSRTSAGAYTVTMSMISVNAGNAQVVAAGGNANRCRLVNWFASGSNENINVQCNAADGTPADTDFEVMFYVGNGTWSNSSVTDSAYAWYSPTGGMPSGSYNYNSGTAGTTPNTVTTIATGSYRVNLARVQYQNASVLVSAYGGTGAPFCNVGNWSSSAGPSTNVTVNCFATDGTPSSDVGFSLSYATTGPTLEQQGGHAWVTSGAMSSSYSFAVGPILGCSGSLSLTGTTVTVSDLSAWSGTMAQAAFASAYSMGATYCKLSSFVPTATSGQASVMCYMANGTPTSSAFTVTITSNQPSGPC